MSDYLAFGRLRREIIFLGSGSAEDMLSLAGAAVREGRAAQTFVVPIVGSFSESAPPPSEHQPEPPEEAPDETDTHTSKFDGDAKPGAKSAPASAPSKAK